MLHKPYYNINDELMCVWCWQNLYLGALNVVCECPSLSDCHSVATQAQPSVFYSENFCFFHQAPSMTRKSCF